MPSGHDASAIACAVHATARNVFDDAHFGFCEDDNRYVSPMMASVYHHISLMMASTSSCQIDIGFVCD